MRSAQEKTSLHYQGMFEHYQIEIRVKRNPVDSCVCVIGGGENRVILITYVNDFIFVPKTIKKLQPVKSQMNSKFKIVDLGQSSTFLESRQNKMELLDDFVYVKTDTHRKIAPDHEITRNNIVGKQTVTVRRELLLLLDPWLEKHDLQLWQPYSEYLAVATS